MAKNVLLNIKFNSTQKIKMQSIWKNADFISFPRSLYGQFFCERQKNSDIEIFWNTYKCACEISRTLRIINEVKNIH